MRSIQLLAPQRLRFQVAAKRNEGRRFQIKTNASIFEAFSHLLFDVAGVAGLEPAARLLESRRLPLTNTPKQIDQTHYKPFSAVCRENCPDILC